MTEEQEIQRKIELEQANENVKSGYIIYGSMKYNYPNIEDWSKYKESKNCGISQNELFNWVERNYNPNIFMVIQLPDSLKIKNVEKAKKSMRSFMSNFEKQLLGKDWKKYHLRFVCFLEEDKSGCWYAHLLFNMAKFEAWHLCLASENTARDLGWPDEYINLSVIYKNKSKIISYLNTFDNDDGIVTSEVLFNLD